MNAAPTARQTSSTSIPAPERTVARALTAGRVHRDILRTVVFDFVHMPELILTVAQGARLWAIPPETCQQALEELVAMRFLARTRGDRYQRARA